MYLHYIMLTNIFIIIDNLPCFGPAFLHFVLLETQQYFGRILISVETELVPPEIETKKILQIENIVSTPHEVVTYSYNICILFI